MFVHLFRNIHLRATVFVQLWKKLYILLQKPFWMKLRVKNSVPKMYSFFLWLYSFLMVAQLFKNIHIRTTEIVQLLENIHMRSTEIVQLLEKTVHFGTNTIVNEIKSRDSVPKMYSFFLWLYSFLMVAQLFYNIHMRTT